MELTWNKYSFKFDNPALVGPIPPVSEPFHAVPIPKKGKGEVPPFFGEGERLGELLITP